MFVGFLTIFVDETDHDNLSYFMSKKHSSMLFVAILFYFSKK